MFLFEKNEIEAAALKHGEDEELEEQYRLVANSKNITEILANACHYVEEGAYDAVDRAARELNGVAEYVNDLKEKIENTGIVSEEDEKMKAYPRLNFAISTYYKGTGLEEILKKQEEYLDNADINESDITNI